MNLIEILLISFGVSLDAFSISIIYGLESKNESKISVGFYFGLFQFIMPLIGYIFCFKLGTFFNKFGFIISFFILIYLGINMIKDNKLKIKRNIILTSIAVSIDAFSIGVSYSFVYKMNISLICFIFMGIITFANSLIGYHIGKIYKNKLNIKTNIIGGIILIILGLKILISHFF